MWTGAWAAVCGFGITLAACSGGFDAPVTNAPGAAGAAGAVHASRACRVMADAVVRTDAAVRQGDWVAVGELATGAAALTDDCEDPAVAQRYHAAAARAEEGLDRWRATQAPRVDEVRDDADYHRAYTQRAAILDRLGDEVRATAAAAGRRRSMGGGGRGMGAGGAPAPPPPSGDGDRPDAQQVAQLRAQARDLDVQLTAIVRRHGFDVRVARLLGLLE